MDNQVRVGNLLDENGSVSMRKFLETIPPHAKVHVTDACVAAYTNKTHSLRVPDVEIYCNKCGGFRIFKSDSCNECISSGITNIFFTYTCKNCEKDEKIFALNVYLLQEKKDAMIFKFGEYPYFGVNSPSRLIKMLGPDKDYFLSGRRAESQGMGIGSFAYYRRVVENQKQRIIGEIIRVAEKIGASLDVVDQLREAQNETQFSSAVEKTKKGMPPSLLINGHNPLTLLHSALSEGLHAQTDAECLEVATSIRLVLSALAEKLGQALKDEAELNVAVSRLLAAKSKKAGRGECRE